MTASEWNSTDHHKSILCVRAKEQFIEYWAIARNWAYHSISKWKV